MNAIQIEASSNPAEVAKVAEVPPACSSRRGRGWRIMVSPLCRRRKMIVCRSISFRQAPTVAVPVKKRGRPANEASGKMVVVHD